jgi:hypothetical protein
VTHDNQPHPGHRGTAADVQLPHPGCDTSSTARGEQVAFSSCEKCGTSMARPASQPGPPRRFCDDCAPPSIRRKRGFVVPYKRSKASLAAGAISQAIDRIEPSPMSQRIEALLREAEGRIARSQKLIRDAENDVRQLRRARG